jgi:choline dehydrogenase-like flavoprotein
MSEHYDVIIIGTGAGGGTLAHRLAPSGKRILVLERGGYLPREPENRDSHRCARARRISASASTRGASSHSAITCP